MMTKIGNFMNVTSEIGVRPQYFSRGVHISDTPEESEDSTS